MQPIIKLPVIDRTHFFCNVFIVVKDALHLTDGSARLKCQSTSEVVPISQGRRDYVLLCSGRGACFSLSLWGHPGRSLSPPRPQRGRGLRLEGLPFGSGTTGAAADRRVTSEEKVEGNSAVQAKILFEVNIFIVLGSVAVCIRYLYVLVYFPEYWIIVRH